MKNLLILTLSAILIVSCAMEETSNEVAEPLDNEFFTEFMPCKAGPDFNSENMTAMISEWQKLLTAEDLQGVWGYAPNGDSNSVGDTGWWEIQWTSEESADQAWEEWVQDEEAMAFLAENESVMVCNGDERGSWDFTFHRDVYSFGPMSEDGSFFTEFFPCKYNAGKSSDDLMESIALYNKHLCDFIQTILNQYTAVCIKILLTVFVDK